MTTEEIARLVTEEQERMYRQSRARAAAKEDEHFYNLPTADADFEYWGRLAFWELDEAVALSLGKAPEVVNWNNIRSYKGISKFVASYRRRHDQVLRAMKIGQISSPIIPTKFADWALKSGIDIPWK